jgi:hypothetical protein
MVRVLNLSPTLGYAKAYDAVATVRIGSGVTAVFAIEIERTLKSEQKYEKILEAIDAERRLHTILYLAPSFEILFSLRCAFERARHDIIFALVSRFERDVLATDVDLARVSQRMTLQQALSRSTAEAQRSAAS